MSRSLINAAKQIADKSITLNLLTQTIQDQLAQVTVNKNDIAAIIASKGAANGLATLDAGGKLQTSQLPALAIGDTVTVASENAMLALTTAQVQKGDVVVVATGDKTTQKTYRVVDDTKLNVLAGYRELLFPEQGVAAIMRGAVAQTGQVALAEVAFTGQAVDVAFSNAGFTATNVSAALVELKAANDQTAQDVSDLTTAIADKTSASQFKFHVVPTGTIDGTNKAFVLPETFVPGTLRLIWNGQDLLPTDDYTVAGTTVTMVGSPDPGDKVWAHYIKAAA